MFDTMTLTKVTAALCGSLLVLLLGKWVAEELFHVGGGHGGHGEHAAVEGYHIDTGPSETAGEAEPEVDFATVFAAADVGKGERVWSKCRACHKLEDGANSTGPTLYAVVDREIGSVAGFGYSGALPAGEPWSVENLDAFLANPKGYAPGTSMSFTGLKKIEDRANLIAYLQSIVQ